jgi:hypothetical protein
MEAAGYTDQQVLEVIAQVGYTSLANWVANLGRQPHSTTRSSRSTGRSAIL